MKLVCWYVQVHQKYKERTDIGLLVGILCFVVYFYGFLVVAFCFLFTETLNEQAT